MSKIIDIMWFCGRTNVGIVMVEDQYEGIKYYIASPPDAGTFRSSEEEDIQFIADWGSTFPKEAGDVLFGKDDLRNGNAVQIPLNKEQAILMYQMGKNYLGINDEA